MGQTKLSCVVAGLGDARVVSDRLGEAECPLAHAVTLFEMPGTPQWRVEAYYDEPPETVALLAVLAGLPVSPTDLSFEAVPDENWVAVSQAALPPVSAGRFTVHGSHDRACIGVRPNAIEIDAGEAFGTAHHATTRGCLEALDRAVRRRQRGRRLARVLDLGCGSGVLAIAASRLLPSAAILASDIDAEAVRVARDNARVNRAGHRIRFCTATGLAHPALRRAAPFGLILANILAGPLIRLAPNLRQATTRGGIAILSGILADQSAEVEAAYRAQGFHLRAKRIEAGWATLVLERR